MSATGTAQRQDRTPDGKWQKGQSGNPGGMPKGLRELQGLVLLAHGTKVLSSLQALFRIGMDEDQEGKVRVAALTAFNTQVGSMTGLTSMKQQVEEPTPDEDELRERVVDGLLRSPETRALVAGKLIALDGGKK